MSLIDLRLALAFWLSRLSLRLIPLGNHERQAGGTWFRTERTVRRRPYPLPPEPELRPRPSNGNWAS